MLSLVCSVSETLALAEVEEVLARLRDLTMLRGTEQRTIQCKPTLTVQT